MTADLIATLESFSPADLDAFAVASQRRAHLATEEGRFGKSLFDVVDAEGEGEGEVLLDRDEHMRPETTAESLAGLRPAFTKLGAMVVGPQGETFDQIAIARYPEAGNIAHVHTAATASGIVDGTAVVLLGSAAYGERMGLRSSAPRSTNWSAKA